jgi:N-methylhydantoinase A/oxoprolinase/acetone carboxylase beta subunit
VKIAGVRTNFTIPDVHSIALGGGSICRVHRDRISVGPDSVGSRLEQESISFGGKTLTVSIFPLVNLRSEKLENSQELEV